jgi:hypothetical protein
MRSPKQLVSEMWANFDVSRSSWFGPSWSALRGLFTESFFKRPLMHGTIINYDLARALYRNNDQQRLYGAGFVRPVIDLSVEYMGIPSVSGTANDAFLNEAIADYWAPQLQEIFRDAMRDSKVIVRYRQPSAQNPLFDETDRTHGKLEVVPPEEADLTFDPSDPDRLLRAAFTHEVEIDERTDDEVVQGTAPRLVKHEIVEVVTPEEYRFYDKTAGTELLTWATRNTWRFVPVWPIYNEYAADLGGGQSDIEPMLPFIEAFHEVLVDTLTAHKYHSIPTAKFKVKQVEAFIKNNWPELWDDTTNKPKPGAKASWGGKEVMFFAPEEDGEFIQAQSVLGDSKTLLEFLIDCIAVAAETPRWALLADTNNTSEQDASVQPFVKKIGKKRIAFQNALVMICKMALAANGKRPETPRISWAPVRLLDLVSKGQAIQQLILGFDVASSHGWLSDRTIVHILSTLFDEVGDPDEEMEAAKDKPAAKRALATTSASKS